MDIGKNLGSGREIVSSKRCHFPEFFISDHEFFSHQSDQFLLLILFTKKKQKPDVENCQNTKIDTFLGQIPYKFDPRFLPDFLKILTRGAKGGIIPKSERNSDVRD